MFHRIFDNDNDGYITKDELREVLRSMDFTISDEDLEQMMFEADIDGNNKVRFLCNLDEALLFDLFRSIFTNSPQ